MFLATRRLRFDLIARARRQHEEMTMPYATNVRLPASVREHLPEHAQDIFRAAFNHAFAAHSGDPRQEEAAHRIAWAAVKRSYVKVGNSWIARADLQR
jgi:cation transport regulator